MAAATYPLDTICKLLDLTPRRVQQLAKEGVIPKAERGRYELVPAVQGYIRYLRDRAINSDAGGDTYLADRSRLMRINADMAELELQKARGEVMPVSDVGFGLEKAFTVFRDRCLALPQKVAARVVGMTDMGAVEEEVRNDIHQLLDDLHRFAAGVSDGIEAGERRAAETAEADPVGVGGSAPGAESGSERRAGPVDDGPG